MYSLLLAIIYLTFIGLGLPDPLLGSGWPTMFGDLGVPVSYAGIITMIICGGTIASSLLSDRVTRRFGAGLVTALSVGLTAAALAGFGLSRSFWQLCLLAVPYGLGAGAVDAAVNNYVALHYSSRHMSWLHCFWGVGTIISPYIMSRCLTGGQTWQSGYHFVSLLQVGITAVLFFSLPLWKKRVDSAAADGAAVSSKSLKEIFSIPGVKFILPAFFAYCALESTAGIWASSYLVLHRGVDAGTAARFASLFYMGITAGRFLCGFVADRFGDRTLIRTGICVILGGAAVLALPMGWAALAGLVIIGLGCAPVYPSIIHSTPDNFGQENSQAIIGVQMASAYTGSTFMPPLFGLIAQHISSALLPVYLLLLAVLMLVMTEALTRAKKE